MPCKYGLSMGPDGGVFVIMGKGGEPPVTKF